MTSSGVTLSSPMFHTCFFSSGFKPATTKHLRSLFPFRISEIASLLGQDTEYISSIDSRIVLNKVLTPQNLVRYKAVATAAVPGSEMAVGWHFNFEILKSQPSQAATINLQSTRDSKCNRCSICVHHVSGPPFKTSVRLRGRAAPSDI